MRNAWSNLRRTLGRGRDLQLGAQASYWRQIRSTRRMALLFWLYVAQAVAGSVIGFTAPFLYFFGVL
jgi:hypothetical protein